MRLTSVHVYSDNRAILKWSANNISIESGINDVIINGFDSFASLLTDYLDVRVCPSLEVDILSYEWVTSSDEEFSWSTSGYAEINAAYKNVKDLQNVLKSNQENQAPNVPKDGTIGTLVDTESSNKADEIKLVEAKNNLARLTRLRCPNGEASLYSPTETEDLDLWYCLKSARQVKSIKVNYRSPIKKSAEFEVSTLWTGLTWSKSYVCCMASLATEKCSISVFTELDQKTDVWCDECTVDLDYSPWHQTARPAI